MGHCVHAATPAPLYLPAAQRTGAAAAPAQELPAGHAAPDALTLPAAQKVPPAPVQGAQLVALAVEENVPAAHSALAVALQ